MVPEIDQPISLDAVISFLVSSELFSDLDSEERAEVVSILEVQRLQAGEEVFHEGDGGDAWYVIFEGQVDVIDSLPSGAERRLSQLGVGASFGEMAILDHAPRSATVRAASPLTIFRFRRSRFEDLLDHGSLGAYKLVLAMARQMSPRLRRLNRQLAELMEPTAPAEGTDEAAARADALNLMERFRISQ